MIVQLTRLAAAAAAAACMIASAGEKYDVQVILPMICCAVTLGVMGTVYSPFIRVADVS